MKKIVLSLVAILFILWLVDFQGPCNSYPFTTKVQEMFSIINPVNVQCGVIPLPRGEQPKPPQPPLYAQIFNYL